MTYPSHDGPLTTDYPSPDREETLKVQTKAWLRAHITRWLSANELHDMCMLFDEVPDIILLDVVNELYASRGKKKR